MSRFVICGSVMLFTAISSVSGQTLWTEENCGLSLTYPTGESDYFGVNSMVPPDCRWRISLPERFDAIILGIGLSDFLCEDGYLGFADQSGTVCGVCDSLDLDFCQIYVRTDRCTEEEIWNALGNTGFFCTRVVIHRGVKDATVQIESLKNVAFFAQFDIDYKLYKCSGPKRASFNSNIGPGFPITRNSRQEDCSSFSNNTSPTVVQTFQISKPTLQGNQNSTMSSEILLSTSQTLDITTVEFKLLKQSTTRKPVSAKSTSDELITIVDDPTSRIFSTEEYSATTEPITKVTSPKYQATTQSTKKESYLEELTTTEPITEETTRDNTVIAPIFTKYITTQSTKPYPEVLTTTEPITTGVTEHDTIITPNITKYTTMQSTKTIPYTDKLTTIKPITEEGTRHNTVIIPNLTKYTMPSTKSESYSKELTSIEPTIGVIGHDTAITPKFTIYRTTQSTKTESNTNEFTNKPIIQGVMGHDIVITPNFTKYTTPSTEIESYSKGLTSLEPVIEEVTGYDTASTANFTKYMTTQPTMTESSSEEFSERNGVGTQNEPYQTAIIIGAIVAALLLITLIILLIRRKLRKAARVKKKMEERDGNENRETLV